MEQERGDGHEKLKVAVPPYLPYKTFRSFLDKFKVGIPSRIDRGLMGNMSGTAQSRLVATLRYFDLISPNGIPNKDKLPLLVASEGAERQKVLRNILTTSYSFLFSGGFDIKNATARQLAEEFNNAGASGETTKKCITFFMAAAKDAGLEISPFFKTTRSGRTVPRPKRTANAGSSVPIERQSDENHEQPTGKMKWSQMLLSKFPSLDPAWPDDVKAKWFDSFKDLMRMGQQENEEDEEGIGAR
jgi:hypothetical protein